MRETSGFPAICHWRSIEGHSFELSVLGRPPAIAVVMVLSWPNPGSKWTSKWPSASENSVGLGVGLIVTELFL